MTEVKTVPVAADESDVRLDRWFRRHFPAVPHGRLEKWLRTGQVRIDGHRAHAGDRLRAGQLIRIPPMAEPSPATGEGPRPRLKTAPSLTEVERANLADRILYADDQVLVIDKPAGMAVQGGTGVPRSLDRLLEEMALTRTDEPPRLVHRLDRDTSGVLVLGRTAAAAAALARAFRGRAVRKLYWAVVVGVPPVDEGEIDAPLAKQWWGARERVAVDREQGRGALTRFSVRERAGRRAAWVELEPLTGRTHQLRVHCAALGTPIVGDGKYGGRSAFLNEAGIGGTLQLHARALRFPHPGGRLMAVAAPLPPHLRETWTFFGFSDEGLERTLRRWCEALDREGNARSSTAARRRPSRGPAPRE